MKFYKTNALKGKGVHTALPISEDKDNKTWTYMVVTHHPQKHYHFKYDIYTGNPNPESSFLDASIKTSNIKTRLREDRSITLHHDDEVAIAKIIKKAQMGNARTSPKTKRMNRSSSIRTNNIKAKHNK